MVMSKREAASVAQSKPTADPYRNLERDIALNLIRADSMRTRTAPAVAWYLQAALDAMQGDLKEAVRSAYMAEIAVVGS